MKSNLSSSYSRGELSSGILRRFSAARSCSILDLLIGKTAVSLSRLVVVASKSRRAGLFVTVVVAGRCKNAHRQT